MQCRNTSNRTARAAAHSGSLMLVLLCLLASSAWGYRPFVSTDAAVVERARMEIELGDLTLVRTQGENTFVIPQVVLNYGLTPTLELVGEFKGEEAPETGPQLVKVLDNEEIGNAQLCRYVKGPDFPTGGQILNSQDELKQIYKTGSGTIRLRGTWDLGPETRSTQTISRCCSTPAARPVSRRARC